MKKVLLLGGGGYIGSVLTSYLLSKGYKVNVLDNFVYDNHITTLSFTANENYQFFYGDFGNEIDLDNASKDVTDVVLLGGLVGDPITKKYPIESGLINEKGVQSAINFFNKKSIDKLVFISTCSNYGLIPENKLADEDYELSPLSLYAKAKVENELFLLSKKGSVNYTGVVLRFATAFGLSPRMRFDLSVSEFVRDMFAGKELLVYDEHTWRPYCHVMDFSRLIEKVLTAEKSLVDFEVFNAGGDMNNFTKKMIVDTILKYIPNAKVKYGSNGSDPRNYKVSFDKVKTKLGFVPEYSVEFGIKELVDALNLGYFKDSYTNINFYGNYELNYKY